MSSKAKLKPAEAAKNSEPVALNASAASQPNTPSDEQSGVLVDAHTHNTVAIEASASPNDNDDRMEYSLTVFSKLPTFRRAGFRFKQHESTTLHAADLSEAQIKSLMDEPNLLVTVDTSFVAN